MENLQYVYKPRVSAKRSIWHSEDLIKSVNMGQWAGSGDLDNAGTFPEHTI